MICHTYLCFFARAYYFSILQDQLGIPLPPQCCNMTVTSCDSSTAQSIGVPGCREKVVNFIASNMRILMYISVSAIVLQVSFETVSCTTPK